VCSSDLFLGLPDLSTVTESPTLRLRSDLLSTPNWMISPLHAERTRRDLHDFAWAAVRASEASHRRVLIIQLDGSSPEWLPSQSDRDILEVLATVAQESYVAGPLAEEDRQNALLEMLSPMRRRVAPLLATGISESEIAGQLGRSKHTVHEHAKAIYQCWSVNSRHELRDLWLGRKRLLAAP